MSSRIYQIRTSQVFGRPLNALRPARGFGLPAPSNGAATIADLEAEEERAARYGHNLRNLAPSGDERALPDEVRAKMESAFGQDFSDVRIQEGGKAKAIGAKAYARGTQLNFAPGKFRPHTEEGQALLGHELAHVVQQRAGLVSRDQGGINADPKHEGEAGLQGLRAARGQSAQIHSVAPGSQPAGGPSPSASPAAIQPMFDDLDPLAAIKAQQAQAAALKKQQEEAEKRQKDRDTEKANLKKLFDVKDDHPADNKQPNQLSNAEFDALADQYNNIREGSTSIKFAGGNTLGALKFKGDTLKDISQILRTPQGRTLIGDLAGGANKVTLQEEQNPVASSHEADDLTAASNPLKGANSTVKYAPGKDARHPVSGDLIATSDTALFHELVHAHHSTRGQRATGTLVLGDVGANAGDVGVNKEEYATVGLGAYTGNALTENKYRAEQEKLQTQVNKLRYARRTKYKS